VAQAATFNGKEKGLSFKVNPLTIATGLLTNFGLSTLFSFLIIASGLFANNPGRDL
jgi:hypothetical protein